MSDEQVGLLREKFLVGKVARVSDDDFVINIAISKGEDVEELRMWRFSLGRAKGDPGGFRIYRFDEYPFVSDNGREWIFGEEYLGYWL